MIWKVFPDAALKKSDVVRLAAHKQDKCTNTKVTKKANMMKSSLNDWAQQEQAAESSVLKSSPDCIVWRCLRRRQSVQVCVFQEHSLFEEHHPLEPDLRLHPEERHLVHRPANNESRCYREKPGAHAFTRTDTYWQTHWCWPWRWLWPLQVWCRLVTAGYNYFHVTNFFWMFGEGCYLHTAVVLTYSTDKLRKWMFICIGWGQSICPPFCLSTCPSVPLSAHPSPSLSVCRYSIPHHRGVGFWEAVLRQWEVGHVTR